MGKTFSMLTGLRTLVKKNRRNVDIFCWWENLVDIFGQELSAGLNSEPWLEWQGDRIFSKVYNSTISNFFSIL